jgi:hypothetical protein
MLAYFFPTWLATKFEFEFYNQAGSKDTEEFEQKCLDKVKPSRGDMGNPLRNLGHMLLGYWDDDRAQRFDIQNMVLKCWKGINEDERHQQVKHGPFGSLQLHADHSELKVQKENRDTLVHQPSRPMPIYDFHLAGDGRHDAVFAVETKARDEKGFAAKAKLLPKEREEKRGQNAGANAGRLGFGALLFVCGKQTNIDEQERKQEEEKRNEDEDEKYFRDIPGTAKEKENREEHLEFLKREENKHKFNVLAQQIGVGKFNLNILDEADNTVMPISTEDVQFVGADVVSDAQMNFIVRLERSCSRRMDSVVLEKVSKNAALIFAAIPGIGELLAETIVGFNLMSAVFYWRDQQDLNIKLLDPASKVMLNFAYLLHLAKIILYFVIFFGQDGCMLGSWLSLACILLQSAAALLVTAKSFFENFRLSYEW